MLVVHGFHVYRDLWVPLLHEVLQTEQEFGNEEDQHAVTVIESVSSSDSSQQTVGHVPRSISRICLYFLQHDGEIKCEITGSAMLIHWAKETYQKAMQTIENSK